MDSFDTDGIDRVRMLADAILCNNLPLCRSLLERGTSPLVSLNGMPSPAHLACAVEDVECNRALFDLFSEVLGDDFFAHCWDQPQICDFDDPHVYEDSAPLPVHACETFSTGMEHWLRAFVAQPNFVKNAGDDVERFLDAFLSIYCVFDNTERHMFDVMLALVEGGISPYMLTWSGPNSDPFPVSLFNYTCYLYDGKSALAFLRRGVDLTRTLGYNPLTWAAAAGDVALVKALIEAGARPKKLHQCPWDATNAQRMIYEYLNSFYLRKVPTLQRICGMTIAAHNVDISGFADCQIYHSGLVRE